MAKRVFRETAMHAKSTSLKPARMALSLLPLLPLALLSGVAMIAHSQQSQHAQHPHADQVPPAPFIASTAQPFPALMQDAMAIMDDGMKRAPMNGVPEHD